MSVQPWTKPASGQAGTDAAGAGSLAAAGPGGASSRPLPGSANQAPSYETFVKLNRDFNEAEEHCKALQEQTKLLKAQLKDREESLRLASHEMEESSLKLKHTRENFQQWETEVSELRERVRKLEENRREMGKLLERFLSESERHAEPSPLPGLERQHK